MTFRKWLYENETLWSTRYDRACDELLINPSVDYMERWLEAAYNVGFEEGKNWCKE